MTFQVAAVNNGKVVAIYTLDQTATEGWTLPAGSIAVDDPNGVAAIGNFYFSGGFSTTPDPRLARATAIRSDAGRIDILNNLKNASPAQIDNYVDNKVTTLADAKAMFKLILKLVALQDWS